ncbi:MAG: hypothetical protein MJ246_01010 [Clostridia bacterium]|nr:hypothetical protein [Clostridia bacterium]
MDNINNTPSNTDDKLKTKVCCNHYECSDKCTLCDNYDTWAESCSDNEDPDSCGGPY